MLGKKSFLKILADKPDIFSVIPAEMLDEQTADQLRTIPRLAVAEISDPADAQPLYEVLARHRPDGVLPTFSYTGTEYGDWARLGSAAAELKKRVEKELRMYVAKPVLLGSPALWQAIRAVHEEELAQRFGITGRCLGCRLYSHMLRVPLCKRLEANYFIPSLQGLLQRGCVPHDLTTAQKYFKYLMSGYGIEIWSQKPAAEQELQTAGSCLRCVLSGEKALKASHDGLIRYFETFVLPAASSILSKAIFGEAVAYDINMTEFAKPFQINPNSIPPKKAYRNH